MTVILALFLFWIAITLLSLHPPRYFVERDWDVDLEGFALIMPILVVFGGLVVVVFAALIP